MNTRAALLLAALAFPASSGWGQGRPATTMPAFTSDSALTAFLRNLVAERERRMRRSRRYTDVADAPMAAQAMPVAPGAAAEAITNTQHAGIDEGDIVKVHGNHLVILRRGRLFTVAIGGGELRPVDVGDAFGPGIDPGGAWYDEMLMSGDLVVVIGYSYSRGGTEVGLFRLGGDGALRYQATFQLRSNDYYSSRNYAARLIGSRLIFYAPLYLPWTVSHVRDMLPALRRWDGQEGNRGFRRIVRPQRVFRPAGWQPSDDAALHTVTSCELATPDVRCEATVVMGPPGNVFYVSHGAVYVWMSSWRGRRSGSATASMLARIPLDGSDPTAIGVAGSPVDQFSFLDGGDGYVSVLVRATAYGDAMWSGERAGGQAALLSLPLLDMGDGSRAAPAAWYRQLETPPGGTFQNRFVGDYLLYGAGNGWGRPRATDSTLYVVPWRGGDATALTLAHGTDRIEVLGSDAVVVGVRGGDLEFSGIRLRGRPAVAQRFTLRQASQGELRSHGFFYRTDGADAGVLGLPVREAGRTGSRHLVEGSASILFLRNADRRFAELGVLEAGSERTANDACRASCVDWYGNARPLFLRGRVFALLGYEIVEGVIRDESIREVRRVSFAPGFARVVSAEN